MRRTLFPVGRVVVRRKGRGAGAPTLLPGAKAASRLPLLRRRGAAALLGAAVGALSVFPALAAEDPEDAAASSSGKDPGISFEAPTPAAGAALTGVVKVLVKFRADEFTVLKAYKLSIVSDDPSIPRFTHDVAPQSFNGTRDQTIQLDWNTGQLTPHNGVYKLVAWGRACDFDNCGFDVSENTVTVTGLKVNNAPAAPQGVKAALQGATPLVSWTPAPEPDVKRYRVMRSTGGGAQLLGTTTASSFTDPCTDPMPCPPGANLAYQVVAVRHSPVSADGILSAASAAVSVVAPQPPAPAPATAAAGRRTTTTRSPAPAAASAANAPAPAPPPPVVPPYPQLTDPAPVPPLPAEEQPGPAVAKPPVVRDPAATAAKLPSRLEEPRVPKARYIAGTLMLLVLAAHFFRGGGLLLGSGWGHKRR